MTRTRAPGASSLGRFEPVRAWNTPQSSASHPSFAGCRTPPPPGHVAYPFERSAPPPLVAVFSPLPRARRYRHRGRRRRRAVERAQGAARLRLAARARIVRRRDRPLRGGAVRASLLVLADAPATWPRGLAERGPSPLDALLPAPLRPLRSTRPRHPDPRPPPFRRVDARRLARQRLREPRGALRGRLRLRRRFRPRRRLAAAARD